MKFISDQYWYFRVVSHWRSQYDRNKSLVKTFAADASEHQNKHPSNKFEKKKHQANINHIKFSLIEKRGGLSKFKNENQA